MSIAEQKNKAWQNLKSRECTSPFKYVGLPMCSKMSRSKSLDKVVENIKKRVQ